METRAAIPADLAGVIEIDATIESRRYLHIDHSGDGLNVAWKVEDRPLRSRVIRTEAMDDERQFVFRQITAGIEEGIAQVIEHDGQIVALLLAQPQPALGVLKLIDLRVDFDHRRQGMGSVLLFNAIQAGREMQLRAICIEVQANNDPANQLLAKLGFQLGGLDTLRNSNHDLVKETVTLLWYMTLN